MRVLWLSLSPFGVEDVRGSCSWLAPLAESLSARGNVDICSIAAGPVESPRRSDVGRIRQWLVPEAKLGNDGLPPASTVRGIIQAARDFKPDLLHVWGSESYWGLLTARGLLEPPALLEIQGLKEPIARVFAGGLSVREQLSCLGLKEIVRHSGISSCKREMQAWSRFEREILAGHSYIATQSPWVEAWVKRSNPTAQCFHTDLALRAPFYSAERWSRQSDPVVFCSAAYPAPFKGIHDALRALHLLRERIPEAKLRIAGSMTERPGRLRDGYATWLRRLADSQRLTPSVDWIGPMPASEIVTELQGCSVMLMPSHCESYGVALAEALYLGVPVVTTHTGGSDSLARNGETALFYTAGDEVMCSHLLERVITDQRLAEKLSEQAHSESAERNDVKNIADTHGSIYRKLIQCS